MSNRKSPECRPNLGVRRHSASWRTAPAPAGNRRYAPNQDIGIACVDIGNGIPSGHAERARRGSCHKPRITKLAIPKVSYKLKLLRLLHE